MYGKGWTAERVKAALVSAFRKRRGLAVVSHNPRSFEAAHGGAPIGAVGEL
jgi:hypothetical protein